MKEQGQFHFIFNFESIHFLEFYSDHPVWYKLIESKVFNLAVAHDNQLAVPAVPNLSRKNNPIFRVTSGRVSRLGKYILTDENIKKGLEVF